MLQELARESKIAEGFSTLQRVEIAEIPRGFRLSVLPH